MNRTRKTEKTAEKKQDGQKHEQPTMGRVHTIAKARPTPVTRAPKEQPAAVIVGDAPAPKKAKAPAANDTAEHKIDEIVVFAFRMLRSERDELHAAVGSGKASRFVKAVVLAAARADAQAVQELMEEVQASRK